MTPLLVLLCSACPPLGFSQTPSGDYLSELAAAQRELIQTETVTIQKLDLGEARPGKNRFTAVMKNKSDRPVTVWLDLRADPGLWLRKWQDRFVFLLWPQQEKEIQAEYEFLHLSPEAWLRVRWGFPQVKEGGITDFPSFFFEKKYFLGWRNMAVDYDLAQRFTKRDAGHFGIYYFPASLAAREIDTIAEQREAAFRKISAMLGLSNAPTVRLVLFPDAKTKTSETGHMGDGWAFGQNIVEIYNEQTKLDPYHELTHILAGQLGDPPAMFNEGFAVYVSELMGADALKFLGAPGMRIDQAVVAHRQAGKFIPLEELFTLTDIGPEESRPEISYPEAASVVKYLIEKYGLEKFRGAYKSLENSSNAAVIRKNKQTFRGIYGKLPTELEPEWLSALLPAKR